MIQACRKMAHGLQALLPDTGNGVLILAYHLIHAGTQAPVDISLEAFWKQMKELQEHAVVCSLGEALQKLRNRDPCRGPVVVLTFDDAYENFYSTAWPVLKELQFPSTLYVPVDFIDGNIPPPMKGSDGLKPCMWSQLKEMHDSGLVAIGSHSCSHTNLKAANLDLARKEIEDSRKRLEDRLGGEVTSFCYPKGLWSIAVEKIVRNHYQSAVIGGGRRIFYIQWDPYRLYRVPMRRDMPESLLPVLSKSVWIEEFLASPIRQWLS